MTPVDPLTRLAAALDPVMRAARTPGERVAVMRAAWAAARVVAEGAVTPSAAGAPRGPHGP